MPDPNLPDKRLAADTDLREQVHEALLAQLLAQVARESGSEALSKVFIGAQQQVINMRVMRGENPANSPQIKAIERHFNRIGAMMHAALIKYSKDYRGLAQIDT